MKSRPGLFNPTFDEMMTVVEELEDKSWDVAVKQQKEEQEKSLQYKAKSFHASFREKGKPTETKTLATKASSFSNR